MAWQTQAKTDDLLEELNYCEDRVRDAARSIRHCAFCAEGWRPVNDGVERCVCFLRWEHEMDGWRKAKFTYEKVSKQTVEPTHDMLDFHKVPDDSTLYSPERRNAVFEMASSLGNKFAEHMLDLEEAKGEECQP